MTTLLIEVLMPCRGTVKGENAEAARPAQRRLFYGGTTLDKTL